MNSAYRKLSSLAIASLAIAALAIVPSVAAAQDQSSDTVRIKMKAGGSAKTDSSTKTQVQRVMVVQGEGGVRLQIASPSKDTAQPKDTAKAKAKPDTGNAKVMQGTFQINGQGGDGRMIIKLVPSGGKTDSAAAGTGKVSKPGAKKD